MKNLLDVISHKKKTSRHPIWFKRQAGRYLPEYLKLRSQNQDFMSFIKSPQAAAEATLQPLQRFDLDAAIIFSDILIVPHALGQQVWFSPGEGPKLNPTRSWDDLKKLKLESFIKGVEPTLEALTLVRSKLPEHVALIGFAGSPWTLLTYMIEGQTSKDYTLSKHLYYSQPLLFKELMSLLENAIVLFIIEQIKAGAEVIQLFDSWAGGIPYVLFNELAIQPHKRVMARVREEFPHIPIITFPRGIGEKLQQFVDECRPDVIALDTMVTPMKFEGVVSEGGIDPAVLLAGGKPMEEAIYTYLTFFKDAPYIVNLGHGINLNTPVAHVSEFIKCVKKMDN